MALARVKVWNPGDILTAADLNGEFNNVLNNPVSLVSPTTGPINFNLQAHTGLVPTALTGSSGSTGGVLMLSSAGTPTWRGIGAPSRVTNLRAGLTSQLGTFSAASYFMQATDMSYNWTVNATSSFTVNLGTAGPTANGRDQAAVFASTYVHWYAISTGPLSTSIQGLVSSNPPNVGPVALPAGYQGWTYLGPSAYTSASTTVAVDHRFLNNRAFHLVSTNSQALTGGTSTTLAAISVSSAIAPNVPAYWGRFFNAAAGVNVFISVNALSTFYALGANADFEIFIPNTSDGVSYQNSAAGGNTGLLLSGYDIPNV